MREALGSGSNTHVPSANTQVVRHPEIKSPNQVKMSDVTNYWDDYLGSNQTNIHPRTGLVDNDRIFLLMEQRVYDSVIMKWIVWEQLSSIFI